MPHTVLFNVFASQLERYAVDIWNSVVKKHAVRNLTPLANAKCKLNVIMLILIEGMCIVHLKFSELRKLSIVVLY